MAPAAPPRGPELLSRPSHPAWQVTLRQQQQIIAACFTSVIFRIICRRILGLFVARRRSSPNNARCWQRAVTNSSDETPSFNSEDYNFWSLLFQIDVSDKFCYQTH